MRRDTLRRRLEALEATRLASRRPEPEPDGEFTEDAKCIRAFLKIKAEEKGDFDYEPPSVEELRANLIRRMNMSEG
jgi:hypothetical protein